MNGHFSLGMNSYPPSFCTLLTSIKRTTLIVLLVTGILTRIQKVSYSASAETTVTEERVTLFLSFSDFDVRQTTVQYK